MVSSAIVVDICLMEDITFAGLALTDFGSQTGERPARHPGQRPIGVRLCHELHTNR